MGYLPIVRTLLDKSMSFSSRLIEFQIEYPWKGKGLGKEWGRGGEEVGKGWGRGGEGVGCARKYQPLLSQNMNLPCSF